MVLKRCMNDDFLSCTYLVGNGSGDAFFLDAGGPVEPLVDAAVKHGMKVSHVLLTHHHHDHVSELPKLTEAFPGIDADTARRIVATRDGVGGFSSLEDLGMTLGLDGGLVEDLRGRVVFLPR